MIINIPDKKGFTLVELSIVLVAVGLLIGGILVAQNLVRWSKLKSLDSQTTQVGILVSQFKMRYKAVPGEYLDAMATFPQIRDNSKGASYCNSRTWNSGNLNGRIDDGYEAEGAFAQLQAAGMLKMDRPQIYQNGTLSANWTCFANNMQQGAAIKTRLDNIYGQWAGTLFGNTSGFNFGAAAVPVATTSETLALDQKFDDGMPHTGLIRGSRTVGTSGYCTTGNSPSDTYDRNSMSNFTCYISVGYPAYYNTN